NYWRQGVFYKFLFDNQKGKQKNLRGINFHFIEPKDNGLFEEKKLVITPEHETIVREQIRQTWQKIQDHEFYKGCGKPDCYWCNFVKDHKMYVSLHEEVDEMEPLSFMPAQD
ncbi:MAG: hypothetical protein ACXWB9_11180, partial [Flavisolibacter sp.]